jgi:AraC-like DNA-binding protein
MMAASEVYAHGRQWTIDWRLAVTVYRTYIPQPPLAAFVDKFWLYEGDAPSHAKERRLPDGSMELVINLRDDTIRVYDRQHHNQFQSIRGSVMCGAHAEFFVIDTACQASVMGVHFKAGGAFPFLSLPAGELHDTHVSLDTLWGARAGDLREQLLEAETAEARFCILEQALLAQAVQPLVRHPAVSFALKEFQGMPPHPHAQTIADVTGHIGLSPKRFIQVFREEVGLTPKLFWRVRRFQEALRLIGRRQRIAWADLALSCGYFDQAHFIHDFRAFSGLNPGAYLTYRGEYPNHVPLSD